MKVLVFDDKNDQLTIRVKEYKKFYGNNVEVEAVLINDKWEKIKTRIANIKQYKYVFSDVHMPNPVKTLELFYDMRADSVFLPIILISTDYYTRDIPTKILGLNAKKYEYIIRRDVAPTLKELEVLSPFISLEQIPKRTTRKSNLDAGHFWFEFFKNLGIDYAGSNTISLVKQLKASKKTKLWSINLFKLLQKEYKGNTNEVVKIIDEFNKLNHSHNHEQTHEKVKNNERLKTYLTSLKDSILWKFNAKESFRVLIIDDLLYKLKNDKDSSSQKEDEKKTEVKTIKRDVLKLLRFCSSLSIECYIVNYTDEGDFNKFNEVVNALIERKDVSKHIKKIKLKNKTIYITMQKEIVFNGFMDFDYLLVDIWFSDQNAMNGLDVIARLHHKNEKNVREKILTFKKEDEKENHIKENTSVIPEILAYTILEDSETIQMVRRMGASGYVNKNFPEGLALAIVRAGAPLELKDATRFDFLSTNNFPCIASIPHQIAKHLFHSEISFPNEDGRVEETDDLKWIRSIPKADNHVHFGTAIPPEWCYILSLISLYHWNHYWEKQGKEKYKKYEDKITEITGRIEIIIKNTLNTSESPEIPLNPADFRRRFLHFFSKEYQCAEVVFLKDVVNYLVSISDKMLNDKQIACLVNVLIGSIKYNEEGWQQLYKEACKRIERLKDEARSDSTEIHNIKLFRDCSHFINNISLPEVDELKIPAVFTAINKHAKNFKIDFDPLSEMLSTGTAGYPYGLERYLASTVLVGSSLLQFADTVLLASMSIPEWAAGQKRNENDNKKGVQKEKEVSDNVIHLELRTTPQGFLNPYASEKSNGALAGKLICVGLEYSIKNLCKSPNVVTANLLISIKRDRDRKEIVPCINTAVDMRDEYLAYIKHIGISESEGFMIPHVSGLDVAGIERNNLPAELHPFYKEAFERCLLSTIHAGETERAQSVKDAIFMLNASRVGHGLSIKHDEELKRLIAERRICVELCPKSNQFTNGFKVFRAEKKVTEDESKNITKNQEEYVYNDNDFRGKLLLTINTDNPTISHKASSYNSFAYPLSEEFIWLSGMIKDKERIPLSRLEVLSLIYNGFLSMFAPEQAKKSIISYADQEVLSLLAAEYLDIGKE